MTTRRRLQRRGLACALAMSLGAASLAAAQDPTKPAPPGGNGSLPAPPPESYTIGAGDVLHVFMWKEDAFTVDAIVRPDGKITLKLVNDVQASGLTPDQLTKALIEAYKPFFKEPPVISVITKQINSRKVCTQGNIAKIGCFDLVGPMDVVTLISIAGGLLDYADKKRLILIRPSEVRPDGTPWSYEINYEDLTKNRRNLKQNYILKPGDILVVN